MLHKLSYKIFPGKCILCGLPSKRDFDLCQLCEDSLPWNMNNLADDLYAPFIYTHPLDSLIIQLKFSHKLIYAKILGELIAEQLATNNKNTPLPDIIIPVPLHKNRLRERGFNQALELAKPIAKRLNIPVDYKSCKRIRNTEAQSLIPAKNRGENVKDAFTVLKPLNARHIVIFDDVVTTGNTTNELKETLQNAGYKHVDIWCCARTLKSS